MSTKKKAKKKASKTRTVAKGKPGVPMKPVPVHHWQGICEHVATGEPLESYCKENGLMSRTVRLWLAKDPSFRADYHQAREIAGDKMVSTMMEICEDYDDATVQSRKLHVDAIKWTLSRHCRSVYGDQQKIEHGGNVSITVVTGVPEARQITVTEDG